MYGVLLVEELSLGGAVWDEHGSHVFEPDIEGGKAFGGVQEFVWAEMLGTGIGWNDDSSGWKHR